MSWWNACHEVSALPKHPSRPWQSGSTPFSTMIGAFDPEQIVAPLSSLYGQITAPLDDLQPGA